MSVDPVPAEITDLAERRAAARRARDWTAADALRSEIEAAGWSIEDAGTLYTLRRSQPADVTDGHIVRYGSSQSVPSRLDEAPSATLTVILLATDWPDDLERTIRSVVGRAPSGTQLVIVANGPSPEQAERLPSAEALGSSVADTEIVWTRDRMGHAAALNVAIRRSKGSAVVLVDTSIEAESDMLGPMVEALDDPTVAVVGPFGLVSSDLRRFREPQPASGDQDVVAIEGYAQAFRRADYARRGPLDEHFTFYRNLDIWWSLVLRDQLPEDADEPRRAVALGGLSVVRHEHRGWTNLAAEERDRLSKRNFYRILKRFATRRDLLLEA